MGTKGKLRLVWNVTVPEDGDYDVIFHFPPNANRATNVPVEITAGGRKVATKVNEREKSGAVSLGKLTLQRSAVVTIAVSNEGTDGFVVADGVQLLKVR